VRVHDQANVLSSEAKPADVPIDLFRRLRQPTVEKNVRCPM
jgi:hypothetical protein